MKLSKKIALWIVSMFMLATLCFTAGCNFLTTYHAVTFDSNGGTTVESIEVTNGETATKPEDPTKVGYTFAGWYLGEEEFSFDQAIKEPITLTAKWAPNTDTAYTVKHFQEKLDGSGYEEVEVETLQGTTDAATNAEAKSYDGFTAQAIEQATIAPDGSTVVEIKYDRNTIQITWVVDGVSTTEDYKYGATIVAPEAPTKAADETYTYEFSGWDAEIVIASEAKTYTATFTSTYINYTVIFKAENGEIISEKKDYHYGDTIVAPDAPVKAADNTYTYTFNGWNHAETVTGNLEYTASYTPVYVNYTVIFRNYDDSADISKVETYHYGDTVEVPAHSENLEGYTYGWDKEIVAVSGNATYTETRTPNTYNVTLTLNGGEAEAELTSYVYSVGATLPNASKVGHTFGGWYTSSDLTGDAISEISVSDFGDKAFYAKWEANTYNVTLVAGEGSLESELTSYVYGVGATLPNATKKGYTLAGWYTSSDFSGEAVTAITATDIEDKTFYAKYTANTDTKYAVEVLVAQYAQGYTNSYYHAGTLSYVDRTSEYASVFGLDENNMARGTTDSIVDLAEIVEALKGAKLNADSITSGLVDADESLKLTVKLDFDEEELGFKVADVKIGKWSCNNLQFTLQYYDGVCGLAIDGEVGNGKELLIAVDAIKIPSYATAVFNYYEKSVATNSQLAASDTVVDADVLKTHVALVNGTNPTDYIKSSVNLGMKFPNVAVVKMLSVKLMGGGEKHIFLGGIDCKEYKRETVTYSIENGNLMDIVKPLGAGTISQVANHTFGNTDENINLDVPALLYSYEGEAVTGIHKTGVVIDLGGIKISEYKTIKVTFQTISTQSCGTNFFCGDTEITSPYGGAHIVDVKALAEAKGITSFDKLEMSLSSWASITKCAMYIASIELEYDENAQIEEDVVYNVNLMLDGGEVETELTSYVYGVGATLPNASKENHTFLGWYTTSDFSGEAVTEISAEETGHKTFFAKFKANTYNVTLVANGGVVETELTSYISGVGATLPTASKTGFAFAGWYADSECSGEAITAIGAEESGDKTYYAKYVPNGDTQYSVKVLVAQYGQGYTSGYYHPGTLTYVDATSEYVSVFGLDENNMLYGETGANVDLSETIATIKGAKLNAESVVSGVIAGDGTLELTVKLDFDEEYLGFKLANLKIGEYSCDKLTFTLKNYDGSCGLAIDGTIGNGKEMLITVDEIVAANYDSVVFNYYEKSATTNTQVVALSEVRNTSGASGHISLIGSTANPAEYIKAPLDVLAKFSAVSTIKQFGFKLGGGGEKHIFISGITKVASSYKRETVTYSMANGNLMDIVTPLGAGTISQVANHTFANTAENINLNVPALLYSYEGDAVTGMHATGLVMNVGKIRLSDYKSIKITFQTIVNNGGTNVFCGDVEIASLYGGAHVVDVIALATAKNITTFETFELSISSWANVTSCKTYIASIEFVLAD